jgi:hypothetical protein
MSWNANRTGAFEFSSIQNLALKNYNLKYFHTYKYGETYALKINNSINTEAEKTNSYKERQDLVKSLSIDYIKKDWISYSWFHLIGSVRMFFDPGRFDLFNFFNFKKENKIGFLYEINNGGIQGAYNFLKKQPLLILILLPVIFIFNLIKIYGFLIFWIKNYKSTSPTLWFVLLIIIYISILTGPGGASRFLVPVIPIYCMIASLGIFSKKKPVAITKQLL